MWFIKVDGLYVHRIYKGDYYVCEQKGFCALNKAKAKRYCRRLDDLGVRYELIEG